MVASLLSNGIWFASQATLFLDIFPLLKGEKGLAMGIAAGSFYTLFTMLGAAVGHKVCMHTESGKSAVGASDKYAQVSVEDWEKVKKICLAQSEPTQVST